MGNIKKDLEPKGKVQYVCVVLYILIGALIGTLIVYIFIMLTSDRVMLLYLDFTDIFAMLGAIIYGGGGGAILGFIVGIRKRKR